jgi:pyruvate carboxylase
MLHVECKAGVVMPAGAEGQLIEEIRRIYPVRIHLQVHDAGHLERLPGKAQRIRG